MGDVKISPSLMCADFLHLGADLDALANAGVDYLHLDIMDGHYVPNFTLGPSFCRAVANASEIPLDVHLMIDNVEDFLVPFISDGGVGKRRGSVLSFHLEATVHAQRIVAAIKDLGVRAGIVISPATPLESASLLLPDIDLLCIMTVDPGFAGQSLVPRTLEKIRRAAQTRSDKGLHYEIEVDGNVSWENIPIMLDAGADVLVAGTSSLFDGSMDVGEGVEKIRNLIDRSGEK